jgi:hypothetical protein
VSHLSITPVFLPEEQLEPVDLSTRPAAAKMMLAKDAAAAADGCGRRLPVAEMPTGGRERPAGGGLAAVLEKLHAEKLQAGKLVMGGGGEEAGDQQRREHRCEYPACFKVPFPYRPRGMSVACRCTPSPPT